MYVCVNSCYTCAGAYGGQKRVWDPLELELQLLRVVWHGHHITVGMCSRANHLYHGPGSRKEAGRPAVHGALQRHELSLTHKSSVLSVTQPFGQCFEGQCPYSSHRRMAMSWSLPMRMSVILNKGSFKWPHFAWIASLKPQSPNAVQQLGLKMSALIGHDSAHIYLGLAITLMVCDPYPNSCLEILTHRWQLYAFRK